MSENLLIVESPAKSKTIARFLGKDFKVLSSYGHIRDLKTKGMGVDIEHGFRPEYEVSEEKTKVVEELKRAAKKAGKVWLASDEDREGEAIAWHLAHVLGLNTNEQNRIVFHEITQKAITEALQNPRAIDMRMVDAQQARRVLDRVVGFELSPVLWRKVRPGLSAGRVQSVAVRLIVDREREIQAFKPESSFRIRAEFTTASNEPFVAELNKRPKTEAEAEQLLDSLKQNSYTISAIEVKPGTRKPAPPFTTSTLQQEASRRIGYPVGLTMRLAQSLYEAGHITYMRTDSLNLSSFAVATACAQIEKEYGPEYVQARKYQTKSKGAQEAHEAIRPTHMERESAGNNKQERALYDLIRKRTLASQMAEAKLERTTIKVTSAPSKHTFEAKGEVITFDGFLHLYLESHDEDTTDKELECTFLPQVKRGNATTAQQVTATELFSQRPARYTEATLVRQMEELGIGRPSTYAPTIQTIQSREYVEKRTLPGEKRDYRELRLKADKITKSTKKETFGADKNKLFPTDTGIVVTDFLVESFPKVLDYNFTAEVEQEFDLIAEGKKEWTNVLEAFYQLFHENVATVLSERTEHKVGERLLGNDPKSGKPVFAKIGRFGPMVQLGEAEKGGPKPQFASIPKELSLENITLEEALVLFTLPRTIGEYEGVPVETNIGRFGPYVKLGKLFVSIPANLSPYDITLEEAIPLIKAKQEAEANKQIATFGEGEEQVMVLNGRFGPYISYQKKNYKIPKTVEATALTEEEVRKIIAETPASGKGKNRTARKTSKKK